MLTSAPLAAEALAGAHVGTVFHPTGKRRPTRLLWLAHATEAKGRIFLDAGAVRALTERRASLLPAGITRVTGAFVGGDPVDLVDPDGVPVARGLVNYDAAELPDLLGRSTRDLARELGCVVRAGGRAPRRPGAAAPGLTAVRIFSGILGRAFG